MYSTYRRGISLLSPWWGKAPSSGAGAREHLRMSARTPDPARTWFSKSELRNRLVSNANGCQPSISPARSGPIHGGGGFASRVVTYPRLRRPPGPGPPGGDSTPMSTSQILQHLYTLDASLDFLGLLRSLIRHDEKEQYLTSLQGSELARLVDFLDKVHTVPSAFYQFTKWTPQALGVIPRTDDVSRECLDKLQAICGYHATLPSSYIISGGITRVGDHPVALCGTADVWEGTYRGEKVFIKSLRVCMKNHQAIKKVFILHGTPLSRLLKNVYGSRSHSPKRLSCGKG